MHNSHNQLLLTKFEKNLHHINKRRQKCSPLQNKHITKSEMEKQHTTLIVHFYLTIGRSLHINNLPDEVLQEVFEYVWFVDGDAAIANLSLVCKSWKALVGMIFFAAVFILGGFLHAMTGKRPPLHLENNTMLCMAYTNALVVEESTKTCLDTSVVGTAP